MDLKKIKEQLSSDDSLYLETKNKLTGWVGCASFSTKDDNVILVFEGSPSGSDDASYTIDEFLSKYSYTLKKEN